MSDKNLKKEPANQLIVGVAGLGLMGRGIVACVLSHGLKVVAYDLSEPARQQARQSIADMVEDLIRHNAASPSLRTEWSGRYVEANSISDLPSCDFIIETIIEDLMAKHALYDKIEAVVPPIMPIASNTSGLPITLLQKGRKHPERFIGMHWGYPSHNTRLLEIVRGEQTSDATVAATMKLGETLGKQPWLVNKDIEGFIANRLAYVVYREALHLLENGVGDVETIDRAFRNSMGLWAEHAGPFQWMDLTGLAPYAAVMKRLFPKLSNATEVPTVMQQLVESGAKGVANGRGFYTYTPEQAQQLEKLYVEGVWRIWSAGGSAIPKDQEKPCN